MKEKDVYFVVKDGNKETRYDTYKDAYKNKKKKSSCIIKYSVERKIFYDYTQDNLTLVKDLLNKINNKILSNKVHYNYKGDKFKYHLYNSSKIKDLSTIEEKNLCFETFKEFFSEVLERYPLDRVEVYKEKRSPKKYSGIVIDLYYILSFLDPNSKFRKELFQYSFYPDRLTIRLNINEVYIGFNCFYGDSDLISRKLINLSHKRVQDYLNKILCEVCED